MSMSKAMRQMPARAGRVGVASGDAADDPICDEADGPRHETGDTGSASINAMLTIACFDQPGAPRLSYLNLSNRPVRTHMPGGVAGCGLKAAPHADRSQAGALIQAMISRV